jgi:hypothetical protein
MVEYFVRLCDWHDIAATGCQRDMSLRISLTLNFPSPDAQVPPQWPYN